MPEPIPFPSAVIPVRRALVSVHEKSGIAELARELAARGVKIVSTGGTAAHLKEADVEVELVEELTGFPAILGGASRLSIRRFSEVSSPTRIVRITCAI